MTDLHKQFSASVKYLFDTIDEFGQFEESDVFVVESDKKVKIFFPYDIEETELSLSMNEIIEQVEEYKSFQLNDKKNRIKTNNAVYYLIDFGNYTSSRFLENKVEIKAHVDSATIELCYNRIFLFGLISLTIKAYHKEYHSSLYYAEAIKIQFNKDSEYNEEIETRILTSFRFELLANHDFSIDFTEYDTNWDFSEEEETEVIEKKQLKLKPLLKYDEGMRMYLVADSIYDDEFKYLSLYKILEHYSSIALRVDVLESLAKKLDSPKSSNPDSRYLSSVIELAGSFELRKRDKELIRTVVQKSVDVIDLLDFFPPFVQEKLKENNISYKTKKGELDKIAALIADILHSTRNYFAHAKANYELTSLECPIEQLDELNEFTRQIALRTIKWYSRLPNHLK